MSRSASRSSLYGRLFPWLLLAAALLLAYLTRAILLPFVAGFAVAYLLDPLADRLEEKGMQRGLAAGLIIGFFFLVAIAVIAALLPLLQAQIVDLFHALPGLLATLRAKAESLLSAVTAEFGQGVRQEAEGVLTAAAEKGFTAAGGFIRGLFAGGLAFFNLLSLILISPVVAFYLLRDYDRIMAQLETLLPPAEAPAIKATLRDIDEVLSGFVRGQLSVVLVMAVLYAAGWTAIGLNYGLLLGLLAGILTIIPFLGMVFAAALALAVGFVQWGTDWEQLGLVAAVWGVAQALEGAVLTPRLVGRHVRLHPLWVLFAVFAGSEIAGFVGVLIAIPAAAVIAVLVRTTLARYRAEERCEGKQEEAERAPPGTEET